MRLLRKYRHTFIIPLYLIFYMTAFQALEMRKTHFHLIHTRIDDMIPFCRYFIVPYILWFAFVALTVLYFAFGKADRREYYQLIATLGTGMTLFIVVSYLYPNGHDLRQTLAGSDVFTQAVRMLYRIDTPTNLLPSIHVFNSVACGAALCRNVRWRRNKALTTSTWLLAGSIVLSTLFLKQHSMIDVTLALALNIFCDYLFYKRLPVWYVQYMMLRKKREGCFVRL
ncbi:MAG: phosphatase PAP2 family protein [Lachnospiraceae bacterium]|nr:phosphatase PAP2 family protein [Lachnospiraceae bacterium]